MKDVWHCKINRVCVQNICIQSVYVFNFQSSIFSLSSMFFVWVFSPESGFSLFSCSANRDTSGSPSSLSFYSFCPLFLSQNFSPYNIQNCKPCTSLSLHVGTVYILSSSTTHLEDSVGLIMLLHDAARSSSSKRASHNAKAYLSGSDAQILYSILWESMYKPLLRLSIIEDWSRHCREYCSGVELASSILVNACIHSMHETHARPTTWSWALRDLLLELLIR